MSLRSCRLSTAMSFRISMTPPYLALGEGATMRFAKTQTRCGFVLHDLILDQSPRGDVAPCPSDHRFRTDRPQRFFDSIFFDRPREKFANALDLASGLNRVAMRSERRETFIELSLTLCPQNREFDSSQAADNRRFKMRREQVAESLRLRPRGRLGLKALLIKRRLAPFLTICLESSSASESPAIRSATAIVVTLV